MGSFCSKHKMKKYRIVCLMTLKSDAKFVEKLTLSSKNDMRKQVNFNTSSGKSEDWHFDVLLLSTTYKVSAKKVQKSYLMTMKRNPNIEEKLTFSLKNDMRNMVNFIASNEKAENLQFDGLLLPNVCNV